MVVWSVVHYHIGDSSDVTLAFEDAQITQAVSRENTDNTDDTDLFFDFVKYFH